MSDPERESEQSEESVPNHPAGETPPPHGPDVRIDEVGEEAVVETPSIITTAPVDVDDEREAATKREETIDLAPEQSASVPAEGGASPQDRSRTTESPLPSRPRTESVSTIATTATARSTRSSLLFVVTSLETIAASKDARKHKKIGDSVQAALQAIKSDSASPSPELLFEPLQLATEVPTVQVVTTALDCLGKLISYSYFTLAAESQTINTGQPPLIERAIDTICDCFQSEATPVEIQLQIVKSLLSAILNDKIVVHGAGLLKAVRLVYNIFLLSKSSANQAVAQGALTQMIGTVFERVKARIDLKEVRINQSKSSLDKGLADDNEELDDEDVVNADSINGGANGADDDSSDTASNAPIDVPVEKKEGPKITLQSFENRKSFDDAKITEAAPTFVTRVNDRKAPTRSASGGPDQPADADQSYEDEEDEIYIRDAYLVFRAMCRLSTKTIAVEHALDVKSQGMRSKLLSLHIIYTLLNNHTAVFTSPYATIRSSSSDDPTSFVQAVKQYLCLSLSRNGASSVRPVFQVSCEIFWLMVKSLRVMLKKEVEVFFKEIYLAILDKRAAPAWQKQTILAIFSRLAADSRAVVEIYLNYDCDRTALDNMFERIVEHLSRLASVPINLTSLQQTAYHDQQTKGSSGAGDWQHKILPPSLSTASLVTSQDNDQGFPLEYALKQNSITVMVQMLRSLAQWSDQGFLGNIGSDATDSRQSIDESRESFEKRLSGVMSPNPNGAETPFAFSTPMAEDDPGQFDREKQRKTALANAIRQFNFKPKRGLKLLLDNGFIASSEPRDIARFLLGNEQINKAVLGEFLGEGEETNIAIMHAFVDGMDFRQTRFVDALRRFLQAFRLPGEAQKIDRFMLKFAERYISGNPKAFANADTAYVLAYSVIMLNTDQHSANIKTRRMTPEDFIKNNRGINDNADLPDEYLRGIFDEIANNEIVLFTEREAAANQATAPQASAGIAATIGQAVANAGRDFKREEYAQTEQLANRTEQLYKSLLRAQRKSALQSQVVRFVPATSSKHVGPMFQVTWMPFFTALTGAAQDAQDLDTVKLCIEGQRLAIRIACQFDLEDPRKAFLSSMARFTNLYNLQEMKAKNVEALKALLEIANVEGNNLKDSWESVLTCISLLDRFQLISTGVDESAVPDAFRQSSRSVLSSSERRKTLHVPKSQRPKSQSGNHGYLNQVAEESRSADIVHSVDRIFSNTAKLSGEAIIYFVKALTQVSWQEIQSSGQSDSPRTYSLQKIVEICNYNMTRVRFEWTNIWHILGAHFNQVGCHTNTNVVFFALDSLRQLSMRFMDLEELAGFKFQKDFLKPFEHIIANSTVVTVKDMVLRCLIQMIQAKGENVRSGWRTMFGVFTVAAKEPYEGIVNLAYDHVTQIYNTRFGIVISQGAFADLIVCLTQFSKNHKFQKKSLQAIETLKASVGKMLKTPECPLSRPKVERTESGTEVIKVTPKQPSRQTQEEQFWFPVLFAFHDVLMTGDDLEVRSRALNYLFETLMSYGGQFPADFWDTLWRQLLYPIFMVLRSKTEMTKMANHEELAVWLSTTMIQALRNMITLFTHFFESLEYMLDRFLELLILCICQENDTLARIGSNCLQQLILQNVRKFTIDHWHKIVGAFIELFARTEATALFSAATSSAYSRTPSLNGAQTPTASSSDAQSLASLPIDTPATEIDEDDATGNGLGINGLGADKQSYVTDEPPTPVSARDRAQSNADLEDYNTASDLQHNTPAPVTAARRRLFNQIITKCVLSLLMIETVNELFSNDSVYESIPSPELLRLMSLLKKSYQFAKRFNGDRDLRTRLFKEGFMKQPPNLLKQESGAAAVYIAILFRMYHDTTPNRIASREQTESALIPLCTDIISSYIDLDEETQQRNIATWRPVVVDVLEGYTTFPRAEFEKHVPDFAPLVVGLLGREMVTELQRALQALLARIFEVNMGIRFQSDVLMTPVSGAGAFSSRRGSRNHR